jgi:UDP-galactose transporter
MNNHRSIKDQEGQELGGIASRDQAEPTLRYLCQTKYFVLSLLVVQNTAYVLLLRRSRTRPGTMYLSSTAVCCVEALKMMVCFGITTFAYLFRHRNQSVDGGGEYSMVNVNDIDVAASSSDDGATDDEDVEKSGYLDSSEHISSHAEFSSDDGTTNDDDIDTGHLNASQPINGHESLISYLRKQLQFDYRLAVVAGIFTIQNNLLFLALTNLDAAVFQVAYQLKVLATAYFSVILLKKELSRRQVLALVLLSMGVALLELDRTENASNSSSQVQRRWIGMLAVLGASCTSGAGCVFFEYIIKTSSPSNVAPSLWANQLQLSMCGLIIAVVTTIFKDGRAILSGGFFQGYSSLVLLVITMQGKFLLAYLISFLFLASIL